MAAVLACSPDAVLSHLDAAALWAIRPDSRKDAPPHVTVVGNRGRRPGIRVHRVDWLDGEERTEKEGIPVTTPGRTLLDLGTLLDPEELELAVARAEREGLVTETELVALVGRHAGERGTPALRAVLRLPGGPAYTRSAAERVFLRLIRDAELPAPECNVVVGCYELDFYWRSAGIGVEVDGFRYHSSRVRFEGDRRKDARLLAGGVSVVRLSWRQITRRPLATAAQLAPLLAIARSR